MTSPSGSEHVSRYRALGEFDNLVRAAREAKRALKELREEEAKLNAQSLADDKKIAASKQARANAEKASADSAKKATADLSKNTASASRSGEDAGVAYSRGMGQGIQKGTQSGENKRFVDAATNALKSMFAKAGEASGADFQGGFGKSFRGAGGGSSPLTAAMAQRLKDLKEQAGSAGQDTGNRYVQGFASKIRDLNNILPLLGQDKLDLDVDVKDAQQSMKALEFELRRISNITAEPRVRIDATRALANLRAIQKLFKDEVAEDFVKNAERMQKELRKIDELPSGKSFKFWAFTALADMSRVFEEADRGTSVFERLRRAAAGGGGGGNFLRSFVSGFDDFSESSSRLLQRLGRVSGELYRMPGIIAVLVSSLPALIAGFGALVGGAGALASGIGALSGFLAAGPGLILAFGTSIGALTSSFSGLGDVLKNARQAQQEEAEAKEKSRLGTEKALTATQKYKLALRDLDPATQKVTEGFVEFSEKYAIMQKQVGERLFKEVVNDMDSLNRTLPILESLLGDSAEAVGEVASQGIRMVTSGPWTRDFKTISKDNAANIRNMGSAGLSLANAFRNITVAAGPFTQWVTKAIREGAKSFSDWSAQARSDGTIKAFLGETAESGKILWQILKNLGNVINSFFQTSVDEGQRYLSILEDITGGWANVAKQQEAANSPLRKWMADIRPLLSSLGQLIKAIAVGIAGLASDQRNISTMIDLLDSLRTDVLPPILDILQQLNDSGIAVTVARALGDILEAIATFLESGATQALTVFVTVLAKFFSLIAGFASLPVVSTILGGLASALAALAAVSIVARFTGLFRLWDFFTWMTRNRGNLSGAFTDAARGAAGLSAINAQSQLPARIPSSINYNGVGSEVLQNQAKATENVGRVAGVAAGQTNLFARSLDRVRSAGNTARGALSNFSGFLGGPWGVAIIAATTAIGLVASGLAKQKQEAQDTKDAFLALKNAYGDIQSGNTDNVNSLAETNSKFQEILESASQYDLSLRSVSGALNNQEQDVTRVNAVLDGQIANLERLRIAAYEAGGPTAALPFKEQKDAAIAFRDSINEVARAQGKQNTVLEQASTLSLTYKERLGGMTQAQVESAVQASNMDNQIRTLSNALDTMASASSSTTERSRALSDIIQHSTGQMENANEAAENWSSQLLGLEDAVKSNGRSLSLHSREGLRNRDALEAAAKATRELYLQDIAAGTPMDEATRKHQERIKELKEEARRLKLGKTATEELIKTYGDIPEDVKTEIKSDERGFAQVYADLMKLQVMQKALQEGKSLGEAQKDWNQESSKLYQRPPTVRGRGDGYGAPGFATGGPVWGAGTRNSDSIRAWLSNGEYVQPTDAVEHYGMPIMEALRQKKLDKAALNEALPDSQTTNFASGGPAHSANCPACSSGGHRFADGGAVTWPFKVNPKNTKVDESWVNQMTGLGQATGTGGVAWMMGVLRKQFPGLPLISGYRPGSRTLSGNRSYHSLNRAVDLPPRRDVAAWIRANYGGRTKELITPFNDLNLHNGKPHRYTGAIWNQHNFAGGNAHDHWAYNKGGLVDMMKMLNMDNLAPQQSAPLPSTPRSLSPAASSVVNNNTESGTTFGDVIINNPQQERAGDSVRNALFRTRYLI